MTTSRLSQIATVHVCVCAIERVCVHMCGRCAVRRCVYVYVRVQ